MLDACMGFPFFFFEMTHVCMYWCNMSLWLDASDVLVGKGGIS